MIKSKTLNYPFGGGMVDDANGDKKRIAWLVFLALLFLALALIARSYFSSNGGVKENKVQLASLNLEITDQDGSALLPLNFNEVYPGWSHAMEGQIKNTGSSGQIFRFQVQNGNADFTALEKTMTYNLTINNKAGVMVYSNSGYLDNLNVENRSMNIVVNPNEYFNYCLTLNLPSDIDDHTTSENEDDNAYQGKDCKFDLTIQSTQEDNTQWNGFLDESGGGGSPSLS